MLPFAESVLKAISDYKLLLRKIYKTREAASKIKSLGLKRKQLRGSTANDMHLYSIALEIIDNLEEYVAKHGKSKSYFGAEQFLNQLKNFLVPYVIEDNRVIHAEREAARVTVTAIQLATLPKEKLSKEKMDALIKCVDIIDKYGTIELIAILNDTIKEHKKELAHGLSKHGIPKKIEDLFASA